MANRDGDAVIVVGTLAVIVAATISACAVSRAARRNHIPGGKATGMRPGDFDPKQLRRGIKVEMEHTDDPEIAQEIAMDHLVEDPDYYIKLATIHRD